MIETIEIITNAIEMGLIYSLVIIGVFITSRIIKFDDLSVEGSFATGGAIIAKSLILGLNCWLGITAAIITGAVVGLMTGLLHTKLKINNLISGLIITTAMFSINLKTAGANISLTSTTNIFNSLIQDNNLLILLPISLLVLFATKWFLNTETGFMLKTVGCNPQMLTTLGKNIDTYKIMGLCISNSMTALAGALFVQYTGFFSITGSIGTLIIALAGLMLGEIINKKIGLGLIIGAILYQIIFTITIELQLDPAWNKLITAIIMVLLLLLKRNNHD